MGPIALFDKSFLQSLSVDESVWFGHYFMPVVCPLFFVETLADLEKKVRPGRSPEDEVRIIADKFPDLSANPCVHHDTLVLGELLGHQAPMTGQIPLAGGRVVEKDGKRGVIYDHSPEAEAFSRWQRGQFREIERRMAKGWRVQLQSADVSTVPNHLRTLGIDPQTCRSLESARDVAASLVRGADQRFERMALALALLKIGPHDAYRILERWSICGYPPLAAYAPYVAHVVTVELFFNIALAAGLISDQRPSHKVDIAYLHYLPFCMVFVSSDRLHRSCAPLFLRDNQDFVWGADLKDDLNRIDRHFRTFPDEEKEKGIMAFAGTAPDLSDSLVRRLRSRHLAPGVDDPKPQERRNPPTDKKLVHELTSWKDAPEVSDFGSGAADPDIQIMSIERNVSKRRGSWWQLPKDLQPNSKTSSDNS